MNKKHQPVSGYGLWRVCIHWFSFIRYKPQLTLAGIISLMLTDLPFPLYHIYNIAANFDGCHIICQALCYAFIILFNPHRNLFQRGHPYQISQLYCPLQFLTFPSPYFSVFFLALRVIYIYLTHISYLSFSSLVKAHEFLSFSVPHCSILGAWEQALN